MSKGLSRMLPGILFSLALFASFGRAQVTNFEHLDFLTQPFNVEGEDLLGVWIYAEPSPTEPGAYVGREAPGEGVTDLDDVAEGRHRLLVGPIKTASCRTWNRLEGSSTSRWRCKPRTASFIISFLRTAASTAWGRTSRKGAGFWAARGLWALAGGLPGFQRHRPRLRGALARGFLARRAAFVAKVEPRYGEFETVRGFEVPQWLPDDGADVASILAVALASYLESAEDDTAEDNNVRNLLTILADGLTAFQYGPPESYPFLAHPSFTLNPLEWHAWGSRQTQAPCETYEVEPTRPG